MVLQHRILSQASELQDFEPFQWFVRECLDARIRIHEKDACDVTKTDEECRIARHLLHELRDEVKGWVDRRVGSASEYIKTRTDGAG